MKIKTNLNLSMRKSENYEHFNGFLLMKNN